MMGVTHRQDPPLIPGAAQPFTTEQANGLAISQRQLYGPQYRTVLRGVFIDHRIPDSLPVRARAALLVAPSGGTVSHLTAACLWTANAERSGYVHLSYQKASQSSRDEIKVHRFIYPLDKSARHGLPVTSPGTTFMHLAVSLDLVKLTAFGDMLVKRQVITVDELRSYAAGWTHHGRRAGQLAASYVRDRVESIPESNLRMLMMLAGLPEPAINHWVVDEHGVGRYRLDLAYPECKVAVEYDGRWHDDPEQAARDEIRREWLRARGWTIVVVKADDLYRQPDATLDRIASALADRGVIVSRRHHEYRRFFGAVLPSEDEPFWGAPPGRDRPSTFLLSG